MRDFVSNDESTWTAPVIEGCLCSKCYEYKLVFRFPNAVTEVGVERRITVICYDRKTIPLKFRDLRTATRWAAKMLVRNEDPNAHVEWLVSRQHQSQDCL